MARGFFGGRKGPHPLEATAAWPQLPGVPAPGLDLPAVAYAMANTTDAPGGTPEAELLASISAFRGTVADALFEISQDYQILCNLTHENLDGLRPDHRRAALQTYRQHPLYRARQAR